MAAILEAVTTIKNALIAGGITRTFIDRDETNPVTEDEMECVSISWGGAEITNENLCQDSFLWRCEIVMDFWAKVVTGVPVINGCDALVAQLAPIFADDFTFGGKFVEASIIAVGSFETLNEQCGSIGVTASLVFQTSKSNWATIST